MWITLNRKYRFHFVKVVSLAVWALSINMPGQEFTKCKSIASVYVCLRFNLIWE